MQHELSKMEKNYERKFISFFYQTFPPGGGEWGNSKGPLDACGSHHHSGVNDRTPKFEAIAPERSVVCSSTLYTLQSGPASVSVRLRTPNSKLQRPAPRIWKLVGHFSDHEPGSGSRAGSRTPPRPPRRAVAPSNLPHGEPFIITGFRGVIILKFNTNIPGVISVFKNCLPCWPFLCRRCWGPFSTAAAGGSGPRSPGPPICVAAADKKNYAKKYTHTDTHTVVM